MDPLWRARAFLRIEDQLRFRRVPDASRGFLRSPIDPSGLVVATDGEAGRGKRRGTKRHEETRGDTRRHGETRRGEERTERNEETRRDAKRGKETQRNLTEPFDFA